MEVHSLLTSALFIITTAATISLFFKAANQQKRVLYIIIIWTAIVSALSSSGFYQEVDTFPPRITFLLFPNVVVILLLFTTKNGRNFFDSLDLKWLTLLHVVRIPVEICLFLVYLQGLIPIEMTFEGYNWDILAGISALAIFYFAFVKKRMGKKALIVWNIICLALLTNIIVIAVLSGNSPMQQIGFDQPNVAVTLFPYAWLPTVIVHLVLISHFAAIRQLLKNGKA